MKKVIKRQFLKCTNYFFKFLEDYRIDSRKNSPYNLQNISAVDRFNTTLSRKLKKISNHGEFILVFKI